MKWEEIKTKLTVLDNPRAVIVGGKVVGEIPEFDGVSCPQRCPLNRGVATPCELSIDYRPGTYEAMIILPGPQCPAYGGNDDH